MLPAVGLELTLGTIIIVGFMIHHEKLRQNSILVVSAVTDRVKSFVSRGL